MEGSIFSKIRLGIENYKQKRSQEDLVRREWKKLEDLANLELLPDFPHKEGCIRKSGIHVTMQYIGIEWGLVASFKMLTCNDCHAKVDEGS